jgi:hypothetical protein
MNAREFTAKRRQTVRLPDGSEFVIRRIGVMDVLVAGGNPDLMIFLQTNGKSPAERARCFTDKSKEMFERVRKDAGAQREFCEGIIRRGLVEPKIGSEDGMDLNDLTFEECDVLAGAILKFSGFTKEAAEQVDPLSAAGDGSKASTPSRSATGGVPANLLAPSKVEGSATGSRPSPSTSPVPAPASSGKGGSSSA